MQRLDNQLNARLPDFARRNTAFMRSVIAGQSRTSSPFWRILRLLLVAVVLLLTPLIGWYVAVLTGTDPLAAPTVLDRAFMAMFWVLVLIQLGVRIATLATGSGLISASMRAESWETLKATPDGAALAVKTHWAAVLYRVAPTLIFLMVWRLYFAGVLVANLTSYEGHVFDVFLGGTVPLGSPQFLGADNHLTLPAVALAVVLMAVTLTASLLILVTSAAFDAALGIWLGTLARGRVVNTLGQATVIVIRILLTGFALWIGAAAIEAGGTPFAPIGGNPITFSPPVAWIGALFGLVEGDQGLSLLHLWNYPPLWANIDHSVFIGVALLILVLVQAALANRLILWSAHRATQADRV
ncbi:MAG TPA: hypothetical protein VMT34_00520 [Aggregatilineales bacterium]|nr:hypothetical protein [Aggregatilineales bacterium]